MDLLDNGPRAEVFLSSQAVDMARAQQVGYIAANSEALNEALRWLKAQALPQLFPGQELTLPSSISEATIILSMLTHDRPFRRARDNQQYLPATKYRVPLGGTEDWVHKANILETDRPVIELKIPSWTDPQFGSAFSHGLLDLVYPQLRNRRIMGAIKDIEAQEIHPIVQSNWPNVIERVRTASS